MDQIKKMIASFNEFWKKLSKKIKILVIAATAFLLVFAIALTLLLNRTTMVTLYTGLTPEETTAILGEMQTLGVTAKVDGSGNIMVDSKVADQTQAQIALLGYPKSGLAYTYFEDVDFLSTDYDKKQAKQKEAESRLGGMIELYDGVKRATVTITPADKGSTVLNTYNEPAKAAVVIETQPGTTLNTKVVEGIATLVASSVERLDPERVSITDQRGALLKMNDGGFEDQKGIFRFQLETMAETKLRDDLERALSLFYGADGVKVTVRVTLNEDDKKTQSGTYNPNNADGTGGLITEETGTTIREGVGGVNGIPGENNNAEIPTYPEGFLNGNYFEQTENNTKYAIDFVEEQLQSVGYKVDKVNITAAVNEPDMTEESRDELTSYLAATIGANARDVMVIGRSLYVEPPAPPTPFYETKAFFWLLAAGVLMFFVLLYLGFLATKQVRRSLAAAQFRKEEERLKEEDAARRAAEELQRKAEESELARMKAELDKISLNSEVETKEQKIREEIREFARENPEIVAQIIKTLLKNEYDS